MDSRLTTYDLQLLFLVGMPGSGKTYWAEHLSEAYKLDYIDMDDEIEEVEDMSITEIFDKHGENWFRQKEKDTLIEIINHTSQITNKLIIATGGGTPCFFDNMAQMKQHGTVIYLRAKPETLINRIMDEIGKRPLLAEQTELVEYAQELLDARKQIYEQAHHILDTENISITTFGEILK
jgi:shikimate kinase